MSNKIANFFKKSKYSLFLAKIKQKIAIARFENIKKQKVIHRAIFKLFSLVKFS